MHDDCCCGPVRPDPEPDRPTGLSRRHVLVAGAAAGGVVALRGVPALGQEDGSTTSSSSSTSTTSTTSTTTTTTTAPPAATSPAPTTSAPPALTEPAHGDEVIRPDDHRTRASNGYDIWLAESPNRGIMFPIAPASATTWNRNQNTYGAPRGGPSGKHQGEDLMAPKMTKLLAVKSGTVVELRHRSGGNLLYIKGDDGWFYGYLHINNDSASGSGDDGTNPVSRAWGPGLRKFATSATTMNETAARGYRVREGEVVAYCGDSGNAESTGAHLHFEVRKPGAGGLWDSPSVDPQESLRNAKPPREATAVPPEAFTPWDSSTAFITAQYQDFLGRSPSGEELAYYRELLDYGTKSPDWLMQFFLESPEGDGKTQSIARLYQAFYKRLPDTAGFLYWMDARRTGGWSIYRVAEQFAKAPEFTRMYGPLTDDEYVDLVYRNVLGRAPDAAGKRFWVDQLAAGMTRGKVMTGFSESPEYKTSQRIRMHVVGCYGVMLNRVPTGSELSTWKGLLDDGGSTRDMIVMLRMSQEYAQASRR